MLEYIASFWNTGKSEAELIAMHKSGKIPSAEHPASWEVDGEESINFTVDPATKKRIVVNFQQKIGKINFHFKRTKRGLAAVNTIIEK